MTKRDYLGNFELIVMLALMRLREDAYGVLGLFCQGGGFRLTEGVLGNRRFLPYLLSWVANFIFITITTLLGGLWGASREPAIPSN